MNNAIRFATGMHKRTNTRTLMEAAGWMDIRELAQFHSLLMVWRIIRLNTPSYLADKITVEPDNTISTKNPRLMNTSTGFRWRIIPLWNSLSRE